MLLTFKLWILYKTPIQIRTFLAIAIQFIYPLFAPVGQHGGAVIFLVNQRNKVLGSGFSVLCVLSSFPKTCS